MPVDGNGYIGDIVHDLGQNMTTSGLDIVSLPLVGHLMSLTLADPVLIYIVNLFILRFVEVLRPNMWLIFHTGVSIGTFDCVLYQSGPLTQFAFRRFFLVWVTCYPSGCSISQ